jgi:hypothetical protein
MKSFGVVWEEIDRDGGDCVVDFGIGGSYEMAMGRHTSVEARDLSTSKVSPRSMPEYTL